MKKGLRDFLGYAKKSSDFFGWTNSEVVIFLSIKYEPLSDLPPPHPPVIKICGWGPWDTRAIFLNAGEEQGACYLKFNQFCQQIVIIHSFINPYNHSVVKVLFFFVEEGGIVLLSNYVSPFRSYTFVHLSS